MQETNHNIDSRKVENATFILRQDTLCCNQLSFATQLSLKPI